MSIKNNGTDEMINKGYAWIFIPSAANGLICVKCPAKLAYSFYNNTIVPGLDERPTITQAIVLPMNDYPGLIDNVDSIISLADRRLWSIK